MSRSVVGCLLACSLVGSGCASIAAEESALGTGAPTAPRWPCVGPFTNPSSRLIGRCTSIVGDVTFRSVDLATLSGGGFPRLQVVSGHLTLEDVDPDSMFPALERVGGDLSIEGSEGADVTFESLTTVGGDLVATYTGGGGFPFEHVSEVGGDVTLSQGVGEYPLWNLVSVGGEVSVSSTGWDTYLFGAGALTSVGGGIRLAMPYVSRGGARLGALAEIPGDLRIEGDARYLVEISLEADHVARIGGDVYLFGTSAVELGALTTVVGGVTLESTPCGATLDVSALVDVGAGVEIRSACDGDAGETVTLSLPSLASIEHDLDVHDNPGLLALDLGSLARVGQDLVITANPSLRSVELGSLGPGGIGGELLVADNTSYPQESAEALCEQTASDCDGVYGNGG